MKGKIPKILRVGLALVLALSLSLVMAAPVSATHTSSATVDFQALASTVTGEASILDVEVTNGAASDGNITAVEIDFTDSDFTVTGVGTLPGSWAGDLVGSVVTYTDATGIAPAASVIFVPVVTNPAEAGPAAVPAVLTTDAGSKAALTAAVDTGWIAYEADSAGAGGNDITVAYVDPEMVSQTISVSVVVKAITVSLATDEDGILTSMASDVAAKIDTDAAALVDALADTGHTTYVVQPLTVPAFTGGTSPDADKVCPLTPATLTITGVVPTITAVAPAAGNAGDTMWVEVTGTHFTATTTACTTTFDFGTGVSVVADSYHWISATEIDCQITITASGALREVLATTAAGPGTVGSDFTPNAAGTEQVDVWNAYTPTDTIFDADTLDFQETKTSIGAAIGVATTGDILIAHAATYDTTAGETFPIVIDDGLTLQSLSGAASTIIDAAGATVDANAVKIMTAADVTFQGFTVEGWSQNGVFQSYGFGLSSAHGKAFILDNIVIGPAEASLQGNSIQVIGDGSEVKRNVVDGSINTSEWEGAGIQVLCGDGVVIDDNWVYSADTGISVFGFGSGDPVANTIVSNNTVEDSVRGIRVSAINADATDTVIKFNVVDGNEIGIESCNDGTVPTGTVAKYNDIVNNDIGVQSVIGAGSDNLETVNAKYNWFGAIGGPGDEGLGLGDSVSADVTYDPWLTETQAKTVTDGIAYLGATTPLQPGWNTLSVPLKLKDSANTLTEIVALGDFLTATNWESAYQYNPALPGWEAPTELVPGRGYYIKTLGTADVNFPVLYSGVLGLPTYDLTTAGWNLIGSMFGVDAAGDYGIAATASEDGAMTVVLALDSIKANTSVVVSPYLPGQVLAFGVTSASSEDMQVGEAYWVFMEATDTLAGFEVTPIYKLFLE